MGLLVVVVSFVLGWWEIVDGVAESAVVVPVDPFEGGDLLFGPIGTSFGGTPLVTPYFSTAPAWIILDQVPRIAP
jgi:hypothetical protein